MKDTFAAYHPLINFLYFVIVIGCTMFVMHPVFLGIACVSGMVYYVYLKKKKAVKTMVFMMLPVFVVSAAVNPLFNHQGVTLLTYLGTGNPLTLESIVYGAASGVMLVSVLNWFSCYQSVMTSDKFIYLFGKIIPAASLILSMVLRFVPKFKNQIEKVSDAQKCIGRDVSDGTVLKRAKNGMKILSIMTTWALENSVETADSMRARGYGLRGRTNFSIYRFDSRDKRALAAIVLAFTVIVSGIVSKDIYAFYFPEFQINELTWGNLAVYVCYGFLCMFPVIVNVLEDIKWHYLRLKI